MWRKWAAGTLVILAVIVGVLFSQSSAYFSSPFEPRERCHADWDQLFAEKPGTPKEPLSFPIVELLSTSGGDSRRFSVSVKAGEATRSFRPPMAVIEAEAGSSKVVLPSGNVISLKGIGVHWASRKKGEGVQVELVDPWTHQSIGEFAEGRRQGQHLRPVICWSLEASLPEDISWQDVRIFDARTMKSRSSLSASMDSNGKSEAMFLNCWHSPELVLAVDVLSAPDYRDLPAEQGAVADFGVAQVKFEHRWPGSWIYFTSASGIASFLRHPIQKSGTCGCIASVSPIDSASFLDAVGKTDDPPGCTAGDGLLFWNGHEAKKSYRLKIYRKIYRLIFRVPKIPGGPNQDVTNLFDVKIPKVEVSSQEELLRLILEFADLERGNLAHYGDPSNGKRVYQDLTVAELLDEWLKLQDRPDSLRVRVDQKDHMLVEYEPWWSKWWD